VSKRFSVVETFNDFRLLDHVTGCYACMGDGVDRESRFPIGSEEFIADWEAEINEASGEYFEAYFPDLHSLEIHDTPEFVDRYVVILEEETSPQEKKRYGYADLHRCLCLDDDPDSPRGIAVETVCGLGVMRGMAQRAMAQRIAFLDLPDAVQRYIAERLDRGR